MATAISATVKHATPATPPHVTVSVTGAPNPPTSSYTANFSTTVDGWTYGGDAGGSVTWSPTYLAAIVNSPMDDVFGEYYAEKTITGLSVGVSYHFNVEVAQGGAGPHTKELAKITVRTTGGTQIATTAFILPNDFNSDLDLDFTATATSHVIRVYTTGQPPGYTAGTSLALYIRSARVSPAAWLGTHVYRTDDNGTDAVVRLSPGQDVSSGTMTVTDWEPCLTGSVTYRVVDGTGGLASASAVTFVTTSGLQAPDGLWVTIPGTADPDAGEAGGPTAVTALTVTEYSGPRRFLGSVHQVIGRSDPITNPGPLSLREGSLTILCATYTKALALVNLLESGQPLRLIQPRFAGMDMLFTGSSAAPTPASGSGNMWEVVLSYAENLGDFL